MRFAKLNAAQASQIDDGEVEVAMFETITYYDSVKAPGYHAWLEIAYN